jgi:hypothetical protein
MYFDGSLKLGGGAGVLFISPVGEQLKYVLVGDKLSKHGSATGILMKCVPIEEGKEKLQEIYEGVYGNHAASRMLVGIAFRSGYY